MRLVVLDGGDASVLFSFIAGRCKFQYNMPMSRFSFSEPELIPYFSKSQNYIW